MSSFRGGAWRPAVVRHRSRLAAEAMTSGPGRSDSETVINQLLPAHDRVALSLPGLLNVCFSLGAGC